MRFPFLLALAPLLALRASAVDLTVTGLDGAQVSGRMLKLAPEIVLVVDGNERSFGWSDVLEVRQAAGDDAAAPSESSDPLHFELSDGSRFGGRIAGATDQGFVVRFSNGQSARLTLDALRSVISISASPSARQRLEQSQEDAREDLAIISRGSEEVVLSGGVRKLDGEHVLFTWKGRDLPLPWARLAGLRLARPVSRSGACTVRLHNGDAFAGRITGGGEEALTLQSSLFEHLSIAWPRIERIECRSERVVFLSDLQPQRYDFEPMFSKNWDVALDRTLGGKPIVLGGKTYAKGISMHSRARLVYNLAGAARQFAAQVGIADEMGARGDVTLEVLADGRSLWKQESVRGGQAPREVLLDVAGVRELELVVDFGENLDLSDQVCWGFARVIR